jgi:hypothetical protein
MATNGCVSMKRVLHASKAAVLAGGLPRSRVLWSGTAGCPKQVRRSRLRAEDPANPNDLALSCSSRKNAQCWARSAVTHVAFGLRWSAVLGPVLCETRLLTQSPVLVPV